MLGRCFVPPGVRVSCTTTTGSDASARGARVSIMRITLTNASLMPARLGAGGATVNVQSSIRSGGLSAPRRSVELDVGLAQEGLGHRLTGLAACLSPGLHALRVAGPERPIRGTWVRPGVA